MINKFIETLKVRFYPLCCKLGGSNNALSMSLSQRLFRTYIKGSNNTVNIKSNKCSHVKLHISGNNHHLEIEEGVVFKKGMIWFEDDSCIIKIGNGTTIEEAELAVAENNSVLSIGSDCMLSSCIRIATTDSHSIIDVSTGRRLNAPSDIIVDDHVWIGYRSSINKGCHIHSNSVVAGNSVVTKDVPSNTVVAGVPAHVVKTDVNWSRDRL